MKWYWVILAFLVLVSGSLLAEEGEETEGAGKESQEKKQVELPRVGHVDLQKHKQLALVEELREKEVVWLDAEYPLPDGASASAETVQVLALQRPSQKPQQHGAVLVVPGAGQHADWPEVVRPIRSELPEAGWFTLSVTLPGTSGSEAPQRQLPVKRFDELTLSPALQAALNRNANTPDQTDKNDEAESAEQSEGADSQAEDNNPEAGDEAENEEGSIDSVDIDLEDKKDIAKLVPYKDKALAHVNAGMKYLRQQGYRNIVLLAYRSSVNLALAYIKEQKATIGNKGFAAIFVNPVFDEQYQLDLSDMLGKNFRAPILEIVNEQEDKSIVKARLASARVAGASQYMQVKYAFHLSEGAQRNLVRRIRFWLEKHAPGMLIKPRYR